MDVHLEVQIADAGGKATSSVIPSGAFCTQPWNVRQYGENRTATRYRPGAVTWMNIRVAENDRSRAGARPVTMPVGCGTS